MNSRGILWPRIVLGVVLVILLVGLIELFRARFDTGDVYPGYSSLRGDPLGTRVLYEALEAAGLEASRSFRDPARADPGRGTIYMCGLRWINLALTHTEEVKALLESVQAGSRLVLAFVPQDAEPAPILEPSPPRAAARGREDAPRVVLSREFGVDARWLPARAGGRHEAVRAGGPASLPERFDWRTALAFETSDESWRRVYEVGRYAAVAERDYGAGTIVLVGDGFLLSNEAMARARESGLLAWLQGGHRRAVFDETHLGVVENSGIASLARRYGLTHAALGLLVVAFLHLWRNGSSLVPPIRSAHGGLEEFAGRDASSGLVNLLRRTVAPAAFFSACLSEYKHSAPWRRLPPETQRNLETLAQSAGPDRRRLLEALSSAHELLKRKP